jgi:hypothetical protein
MSLVFLAGVEALAGVVDGVDVGTRVVVPESVDALEFARAGVCSGRGRW